MADIRLKVTPDELKRKAGELEKQIGNAQRNWNALCEAVHTSRYYWEGEAADRGRNLLDEMTEDVRSVFCRLKEHPSDLLEMAGVYTDAEKKAVTLANSLPADVIQ